MFEESLPRRKRRNCDFPEDSLAEEIKKVRISYSPGELRLQSDLKDFDGSTAVTFSPCEDTSSRILTLLDIPDDCPCSFLVQINRHYPHKPPIVTCLDPGFYCEHIDTNGIVRHPELLEHWVAVYSLAKVVEVVRGISLSCNWKSMAWQSAAPAYSDTNEYMEETSL